MKQTKKILIFTIIMFVLLTYIIIFIDIRMHEKTHLAIMKNFGHNDAYITYKYCGFYGGTNKNDTMPMIIEEQQLHSLNEIMHYNLVTILVTMIILTYFIVLVILIRG